MFILIGTLCVHAQQPKEKDDKALQPEANKETTQEKSPINEAKKESEPEAGEKPSAVTFDSKYVWHSKSMSQGLRIIVCRP